jgi:hypothetical protein
LICAIALHRSGDISDPELYTILEVLDVDPNTRPSGPTQDSLEAVAESCKTGEPLSVSDG